MLGRRFPSNEELTDTLTTRLNDQYKEFYFKMIYSLKDKYNKCVEPAWNYIEK